ncbi:hypothetical protein LAG90_19095 [Marinilongibacter aquaticus]|uniref:hypothetical protein n=1 Tax=Marinilongibacter aquaticus TaxID=2975157 RepID=UPI0021BDAC4F|nr:hypothetical protein [Marinilongibacter aquaticus]UBM58908.1 hypothetical protein LAG90_19095 [Marinilongibacter aquaticus]
MKDTETSITVVPFGGLGNRMRAIQSAIELKSTLKISSTLSICWLEKSELNAPFFSLFQSIGTAFRLVSGLQYFLFLKLLKHVFVNQYSAVYRFLLSPFYDLILLDEDLKSENPEYIHQRCVGKKRILIATCYKFQAFENFDNFMPSVQVKERLHAMHLPKGLVGVHIRRTDHLEIIRESALGMFENEMKALLEKESETQFYLATDEKEVKERLIEQFGNNVLTQAIELNRASPDGVLGAWLDILALSRCEKIICNLKSSFAETALMIGEPKEIIQV